MTSSATVDLVVGVQTRLLNQCRQRRYVADPRDPRLGLIGRLLRDTVRYQMRPAEVDALLLAYSFAPSSSPCDTTWLDLQVQLDCLVPHLARHLRFPASAWVDTAQVALLFGGRVASDGVGVCTTLLNVLRMLGDATWLLLLPGGASALHRVAHDPAALHGMTAAVQWAGLDATAVLLAPIRRIFGGRAEATADRRAAPPLPLLPPVPRAIATNRC